MGINLFGRKALAETAVISKHW